MEERRKYDTALEEQNRVIKKYGLDDPWIAKFKWGSDKPEEDIVKLLSAFPCCQSEGIHATPVRGDDYAYADTRDCITCNATGWLNDDSR